MVMRGESDGHRPSRFTSARVVVTGGAQGIGHEIVTAFAAEGARVAILDRLVDEAHGDRRRDRRNRRASAISRTRRAPKAAMDTAIGELGGIDVLVNNAGVFTHHPAARHLRRRMGLDLRRQRPGDAADHPGRGAHDDRPGRRRQDRQHGEHGRQGRRPGPGALRGIEGRRHLAHPGVGHGTGLPTGSPCNSICPGYVLTEMGAADPHARDGRRMVGEVAARAPGPTGGRGRHGPVPGVGRRRLLHRTGVERHRWNDHALTMTRQHRRPSHPG